MPDDSEEPSLMHEPSSNEMDVLKNVDKLSNENVNLVKDLVHFKSINPPGDESEIAEYIFLSLKSLGFRVKKIETAERRTNVIARFEGKSKSKTIIFNGHMDVVPVADLDQWTVDPFDAQVKGKYILGRGTTDMKGALACCLVAAKAIVNSEVELDGSIEIHAVADEENGSKYGTRALIEKGLINGKMAVVMEGSVFNDRIYVRSAVRGLHWIEIETKGKAAHGSMPGYGVNAVLKMSKILLALDKHKVKYSPHELLPAPSLGAGTMIQGGIRENVIPPSCKAIVDLRVIPGMTEKGDLAEMDSVIRSLANVDKELEAIVRTRFFWPPGEVREDSPLVSLAKAATQAAAGLQLATRGAPGSNDSTFINHYARIPAVAFGPGDVLSGKSHGADERVSVHRLNDFSRIYALMAVKAAEFL